MEPISNGNHPMGNHFTNEWDLFLITANLHILSHRELSLSLRGWDTTFLTSFSPAKHFKFPLGREALWNWVMAHWLQTQSVNGHRACLPGIKRRLMESHGVMKEGVQMRFTKEAWPLKTQLQMLLTRKLTQLRWLVKVWMINHFRLQIQYGIILKSHSFRKQIHVFNLIWAFQNMCLSKFLQSFCTTKEMISKRKRLWENICQLHIR
jgi:hypothetical protein